MPVINTLPRELEQQSPWIRNWYMQVYRICFSAQDSGTTAQRPIANSASGAIPLWVGRTYFDTDLGIPIWIQSLSPTVWVDATGAPA